MDVLRRTLLEVIAGALSLVALGVVPALAQTSVQVGGQANPYLAGMPNGSTCCASEAGVDTAPAQSPVQVPITVVPGAALTFNASGAVGNDVTNPGGINDPDGGDFFFTQATPNVQGTPSSNGLSAVNAPVNALLGVFLSDAQPNTSGPPPRLDFNPATGLGLAFNSVSPALKQVFFIGDGLTGRGAGNPQQFIVPPGATRLFLGTTDGIGWLTNFGAFNVQVNGGGGGGGTAAIAAAVLPSSRSVQVGAPATAFVSIINAGPGPATGCGISPVTGLPAAFLYQTTNAANQLIGAPNTPANIAPGGVQTYLIAFTPQAAFGPTDVVMNFQCSNTAPATTFPGINTLLLTASATPVPDIIAIAATASPQNILNVVGGSGAFAVATSNVGASSAINVSADTGGAALPLAMSICQTNAQGVCLSPPQAQIGVNILSNQTPTFSIFVTAGGAVPLNPGANRIYVRFTDPGGVTRGSTSVAVQTQ
jgi:hypothetical protein